MRLTLALIAMAASTALLLAACAKTETPEEARAAAQETYAEFDRMAAEGREANGEEEEIVAGLSPGQINTGSSATLTAGSWSVATEDGERMASFGEEGSAARITIACETGGGIDVRLIGMPPQGGTQTVYFSSPEGGSTFTASEAVGDIAAAYISVPASDPFIARLISGNGPYSIRMGGSQALTFPADDALTSIVSSCDRRDTTPIADAGAESPSAERGAAEARARAADAISGGNSE